MVQAFIDEGGCDQHAPVVSVGCYYATPDQWAAFEGSWTAVLRQAEVECFHATEHRPLWEPMLKHIQEYGLEGTLTTVAKDEYRGLFGARAKSHYGDAYSCCAIGGALNRQISLHMWPESVPLSGSKFWSVRDRGRWVMPISPRKQSRTFPEMSNG